MSFVQGSLKSIHIRILPLKRRDHRKDLLGQFIIYEVGIDPRNHFLGRLPVSPRNCSVLSKCRVVKTPVIHEMPNAYAECLRARELVCNGAVPKEEWICL